MATPPALAALPRALARAALRFAARAEGVPFSLRAADVRAAGAVDLPSCLDDSAGVRAAVRAVSRGAATSPDASAALDAAIAAVARLHTDTAASVAAARAARALHEAEEKESVAARAEAASRSPSTHPAPPGAAGVHHPPGAAGVHHPPGAAGVHHPPGAAGVHHPPGFVGVHRLYAYRFVVLGHDAACARGPDWAAAVGGDPASRWYSVLPDEGDCVALFGAPRSSKYVAAANVAPAPRAARVAHRGLRHFFDGYSPATGRYVPNRRLRFEYPTAQGYGEGGDDVESIEGDAAVLFPGREGGGGPVPAPAPHKDGLAAGEGV